MADDSKVVKIISELSVGVSTGMKNLKDLEAQTRKSSQSIVDQTKRMQRELTSMWNQREAEEKKISQQMSSMWTQRAKEQTALDNQRLQHGLSVERQLALEAQKQAKSAATAQKQAAAQMKADAVAAQKAILEQQRAGNSLPTAQAQIAAVQAKMRAQGVYDVALRNESSEIRKQITLLQDRYAVEKKLSSEEVTQLNNLRLQTQQLNAQVSQSASDKNATLLGSMETNLSRRMGWFTSGLLAYGGITVLQDAVTEMTDIESRMVALARIMEDPAFSMAKAQKAIFELAQEYGFTFQQVIDITTAWAQAGYNLADSLEATRSSLLALNTAELSSEESTQGLIAIMTQWNMSASEMESVIDRINRVADDFPVSSADLIAALQRSSGAAKNAGLSFNELVAYVTSMKTAIGAEGGAIGNALNSIFNFFTRDKSQKILEANGIAVFADAAKTKLRPVSAIIEELSKKWDGFSTTTQQSFMEDADAAGLMSEALADATGQMTEWTDLQKRDILNAGAQSYRRNYLLGLLRNFSQVYDVLNAQEGAMGYSQKENAKTMETLAKQVQSLKAEWQEMIMSLGQEGGAIDGLKAIVKGVKSLVDEWNNLSPAMKKTIFALAEVTLTWKAFDMMTKRMTGAGIVNTFLAIKNGAAETLPVIGKMKQVINSLGGLSAVTPWIVGFYGLGAAIGIAAIAISKFNERADRLEQTVKILNQGYKTQIEDLENQSKLHSQNALLVDKLAAQYRKLEEDRAAAIGNGADAVKLQQYAAQQEGITQQVEAALGKETAARLQAAKFSEEATKLVKDAEKEKTDAISKEVQKNIQDYEKLVLEEIDTAKKEMSVIELQMDGWEQYLHFGEYLKVRMLEIWGFLKKGWYNLLSDVATIQAKLGDSVASFFEQIGAEGLAKKYRDAAMGKYAEAYNYEAEANFGVDKEIEWRIKNLAADPALQRKKETLKTIYAELAKLREDALSSGTNTNGVITTPEDNAKAAAAAIVDKVDALKAESDATLSLISIIKSRIAYNTREKASVDDLAQADKDRAQLLTLINQRQGELATIAQASRDSIDSLRMAQSKLNRSTTEGNSAWEDMENKINSLIKLSGTNANPLGSLSEEWWSLQSDKDQIMEQDNANSTMAIRNLKSLKESYDKGLLPLNSYVDALGRLETQAGLTANAINEINIEQGSALLKKWTNDLETALDSGDKALKKFGDDLDVIFNDATKSNKAMDSSTLMNTLRGNLSSVKGSYGLPTNTLQAAQASTKGMIGDILNGKFSIDSESLLKMDRTSFITAVTQGKNDLMAAGKAVNDLIISIGNERAGVIRDIEGQIKPIQDTLDKFSKWEKQDNTKQLQDTMNESLGKLYGNTTKLPGMPTITQMKSLVGSIKVDDLGALSPDKFASVMQQNMESLRGVATTTKGYLNSVSKNFQSQIDSVDAQILKVDADLKVTLDSLQKQMDALDQQNTDNQRDKDTQQYQANRKAITDEIAWRMQNEDKYAFEIAAKKSELAKLDKDWADKQRDWQNEDAKKSIQDQMDNARTAAEERKAQLEDEKRNLEEQRQMWQDALNSVLSYVNGQITGLKELGQERVNTLNQLKDTKTGEYDTLLEALGNVQKFVDNQIGEWQRLSDQRKAIESDTWDNEKNGIRKVMNDGALNVLADMTAKGFETGQSYVDSIISGVNSKKSELDAALQALTNTTTQYQQAQATTSTTTTTTMNVPKFANEGYVRARRGGTLGIFAEAGVDEAVLRVDRLQPKIDLALTNALRNMSSFGGVGAPMSRSDYADMLDRTVRSIASAFPSELVANFVLPDGTVQRQVIKVFKDSALMQAVHAHG